MTKHPLLAALAMLALIGAGCAGSDDSGGATKNASNRSKAAKFAACMRDNGVSAFPDPDASGDLTIDEVANHAKLDTDTAAFENALSACKDLEPPGFTGPGRRSPQQQKHALAFAQCIRDNGVKDFPDPVNGQPLVDTRRIPSANRAGGMTILNAAMRKCGDVAAGAGAGPR
jgi:hypothetical protein